MENDSPTGARWYWHIPIAHNQSALANLNQIVADIDDLEFLSDQVSEQEVDTLCIWSERAGQYPQHNKLAGMLKLDRVTPTGERGSWEDALCRGGLKEMMELFSVNPVRQMDWFDVSNREHLEAWEVLQRTGSWPEGFAQDTTFPTGWEYIIKGKMADAWLDYALRNLPPDVE